MSKKITIIFYVNKTLNVFNLREIKSFIILLGIQVDLIQKYENTSINKKCLVLFVSSKEILSY